VSVVTKSTPRKRFRPPVRPSPGSRAEARGEPAQRAHRGARPPMPPSGQSNPALAVETEPKLADMTCSHCEATVKQAVEAVEGVVGVAVDLEAKTVTVTYDEAKTGLDVIKQAIVDSGYEVS